MSKDKLNFLIDKYSLAFEAYISFCNRYARHKLGCDVLEDEEFDCTCGYYDAYTEANYSRSPVKKFAVTVGETTVYATYEPIKDLSLRLNILKKAFRTYYNFSSNFSRHKHDCIDHNKCSCGFNKDFKQILKVTPPILI